MTCGIGPGVLDAVKSASGLKALKVDLQHRYEVTCADLDHPERREVYCYARTLALVSFAIAAIERNPRKGYPAVNDRLPHLAPLEE